VLLRRFRGPPHRPSIHISPNAVTKHRLDLVKPLQHDERWRGRGVVGKPSVQPVRKR